MILTRYRDHLRQGGEPEDGPKESDKGEWSALASKAALIVTVDEDIGNIYDVGG